MDELETTPASRADRSTPASTMQIDGITLRIEAQSLEIEVPPAYGAGILVAMFGIGCGALVLFGRTRFGNALSLRLALAFFCLWSTIAIIVKSIGRERLNINLLTDRFEYKSKGGAVVAGGLSDLGTPGLETSFARGATYYYLGFRGGVELPRVFAGRDQQTLELLRDQIMVFRQPR